MSDIHCGGWMAEQELALLVGNKRFPQSSKDIPFDDVPFVITTWDKWRVTATLQGWHWVAALILFLQHHF